MRLERINTYTDIYLSIEAQHMSFVNETLGVVNKIMTIHPVLDRFTLPVNDTYRPRVESAEQKNVCF